MNVEIEILDGDHDHLCECGAKATTLLMLMPACESLYVCDEHISVGMGSLIEKGMKPLNEAMKRHLN